MPHEVFQFTTLARVLPGDVELAEPLGFPEISSLDDAERKWRASLQAKAKMLLRDAAVCPPLRLHRRRAGVEASLREVELTFDPPRRAPDWQEPVRVRIPFVTWMEEELHHAFVPALGVRVFATRASLIDERVEQHVRLVLAGRRKHVTLAQLAGLTRVQSLRLGGLEVHAHLKTPRQLADDTEPEKPSTLVQVAEELPPVLPRNAPEGEVTAKPPAPVDPRGLAPAAFEMENEVRLLAGALSGPNRRSVLLVGPAGCGKTALVRELARRRGDFGFGHTPFWATSGARLVAGQIGFGMWQERCQRVCREASKTNAILHLGNLAELLEVGKASRDEQSVGGFLRPWIARSEILVIAECTPEQLGAIERLEPHLPGAFYPMTLAERTPEQTRLILDQAFGAAPGKALDTAAASANRVALDRLQELHRRYATYSANPGRPLRFLQNLLADRFPEKAIAEADVTAAFSRETGLPGVLLDDRQALDLERTGDWFSRRVIGQPEAAGCVLDLLALIKARLARPRKPLASLLFIGPTGTGKTEMAKALAEFLFGDAARLVRFDLNEFSDPASVQRLIGGATAGGAEGLLTARVREQPFSVLLLDEFEKADPGFFDLLLQILGDGRLTDAAGRVADFCNSVIVMTSNLGAQGFQQGPAGFRADHRTVPDAQAHFTGAVRQFLRPEIFNRLDAVVPFRPLTTDSVLAIARRHLELIRQRDGLCHRPVEWQLQPEVAGHLAARGYDARYGARPLKRVIERELLVPLAEALNEYAHETPLTVSVGATDGRVQIRVRAQTRPDAAGTGPSGASAELAGAIVRLRRLVGALEQCAATRSLENQATLLASIERRLEREGWKSPQLRSRLEAQSKIKECLGGIAAVAARARHLESEALTALHQREEVERALFEPEATGIERDRSRLLRDVFRLSHEAPDDIVLAFYSEDRETLLEFAAAFRSMAAPPAQVAGLDFFLPPPGGRSAGKKLVRETPGRIDAFFTTPPEKLIAIAMHLRGDLFFPRFSGEAGLHVVKEKSAKRACLIEIGLPPLAGYEPPAGIERAGGIQARGAPLRRTYDREKKMLIDSGRGEYPWNSPGLDRCLAALCEERLGDAIEAVTKGPPGR